jgi:sugar phosphate isomerase/epimerase
MTVVGFTTIHPNPGVRWEDVQKQIKKACDLARKHGAENVTVLVTMIGGQRPTRSACSLPPRTGRSTARSRRRSWTTPKMLAVLQEAGQIAIWETYVSQTIPDM